MLSLLAALAVVACMTGTALAQEDTMPAHPMFERLRPTLHPRNRDAPATPLTTWNGSFVYKSHTYHYNMVGTAPSTGTSTTVKVFLIPIALKYVSKRRDHDLQPPRRCRATEVGGDQHGEFADFQEHGLGDAGGT